MPAGQTDRCRGGKPTCIIREHFSKSFFETCSGEFVIIDNEQIAGIAEQYALLHSTADFGKALCKAARIFKTEHEMFHISRTKRGLEALEKNVIQAIRHISAPSVIRLLRESGAPLNHHQSALESLRLDIANAQNAKARSPSRRADVRAASKPLIEYWTQVLGRSPSVADFGGNPSPFARFLHACILVMDPTISVRIFQDIYKE